MNWIKVVPLSRTFASLERDSGLPCIMVVQSPKGPEAVRLGTHVHRDSEADGIFDELACELDMWVTTLVTR